MNFYYMYSFVLLFELCPHSYGMRPQIKGLSHGLKTCHRHVFLTAFRVPSKYQKREGTKGTPFLSLLFDFRPHPYRMRPQIKGLSHGLKTCHRHVFLTAFRVPSKHQKREGTKGTLSFLVREMGLEPTRRSHTHLKRACLPFQHSRERLNII